MISGSLRLNTQLRLDYCAILGTTALPGLIISLCLDAPEESIRISSGKARVKIVPLDITAMKIRFFRLYVLKVSIV